MVTLLALKWYVMTVPLLCRVVRRYTCLTIRRCDLHISRAHLPILLLLTVWKSVMKPVLTPVSCIATFTILLRIVLMWQLGTLPAAMTSTGARSCALCIVWARM